MTDTFPKSLIPVHGRPFVGWQLDLLASQGVGEVLFLVGYRGSMIRDYVGDGADWGVKVMYADEGEELRGTGGALRLAVAQGLLPQAFFLLYGDSFLSVDLPLVVASWRASGLPALMTVLRNEGRWDKSNAVLREGRVTLYDKNQPSEPAEMQWVDYGLSVLTAELVGTRISPGAPADIADLMRDLSIAGELAGFEVSQRFYEVGSTQGLNDLEAYLSTLELPTALYPKWASTLDTGN